MGREKVGVPTTKQPSEHSGVWGGGRNKPNIILVYSGVDPPTHLSPGESPLMRVTLRGRANHSGSMSHGLKCHPGATLD